MAGLNYKKPHYTKDEWWFNDQDISTADHTYASSWLDTGEGGQNGSISVTVVCKDDITSNYNYINIDIETDDDATGSSSNLIVRQIIANGATFKSDDIIYRFVLPPQSQRYVKVIIVTGTTGTGSGSVDVVPEYMPR